MKDWTKIGVWFGIAAILGAFLWVKMTHGSPLVFQFHSPSFSGIGQSSHYLTIENLEKSRKQAIIDKAKAEERQLENELRNTAIEIFRRNLESLFYSNLANQILDNIFGEDDDQQKNGETIIGDYKVVWTSTDDPDDVIGVTVKITNTTTGEVIYEYGFPYQEPADV
jgi:hypothetical protein